jgi:hypothetical protein
MEATYSSEKPVDFQRTTRRCIPEDRDLKIQHAVAYRPVARQRPRNRRVQPLLCNRRINGRF